MSYLGLSASEIQSFDQFDTFKLGELFANLSYNQTTNIVTGGGTGTTVNSYEFVAPVAMKITDFKVWLQVVQTGTDNLPVISLRNATQNVELATTGAIALGGAIGDLQAVTMNTTNSAIIAKGDKIQLRIVTPAATVTVPIQVQGQFEWNARALA